MTVSDLPAQWAQYDVYVYYLDGDANAGRAGNYTITSTSDGRGHSDHVGHGQLEPGARRRNLHAGQ